MSDHDNLSSTGGQGVNVSDQNSADAAAAVESISKPAGTVAPDASARSEHTAESQLRHADEHDDRDEKHYPNKDDGERAPTEPQTPPADESGGSRPNTAALNPEDNKDEAGIRAGSEEDQESAVNLQPNQDPEDDTASKVLDDADQKGDK